MDQSGKVDSYEFICGLAMLSSSSLDVNNFEFKLNHYLIN